LEQSVSARNGASVISTKEVKGMNKKFLTFIIAFLILVASIPTASAIPSGGLPEAWKAINDLIAKVANLQDQIANIQLTPGPQGETGPAGPQGPQGPTGAMRHFGGYQEIPVDLSSGIYNHYNAVETDGFVVCTCWGISEFNGYLAGDTMSGTKLMSFRSPSPPEYATAASITMPVQQGAGWNVRWNNCNYLVKLYWIPLIPPN
jgi:hypothetical protein